MSPDPLPRPDARAMHVGLRSICSEGARVYFRPHRGPYTMHIHLLRVVAPLPHLERPRLKKPKTRARRHKVERGASGD